MGQPILIGSPLYFYFLGGIYRLVGAGPWAVRLVQLALGLGTVALVHDCVRRLFGARWALAAGLCAAFYGPLVFEESQLEPETLAAFLHALLAWSLLRLVLDGNSRARRFIAPGLVLGLCVLARPSALVLGIAVAAAVIRAFGRRALAPLGVATVMAALTVTPILVRNRHFGGEARLMAFAAGINLYIGNGPGANGTFRIPPQTPGAVNMPEQQRAFRDAAERALGRPLRAGEVDRYFTDRSVDAIRAAPGAWLRLMGKKLLYYFGAQEPANNADFAFQRRLNPALAIPFVTFGVIAPLALIGALVWLRRRTPEGLLFAVGDVVECLAVVAFFVVGRYRIAAVPAAIVSAAAGLRWLVAESPRGRVALGALLAALYVVTFTPRLPEPLGDEWFKLGYAYQSVEKPADAEQAYLRALALEPRHLSAHKNLALLYESEGNIKRAVVHWQWVYGIALAKGDAGLADFARGKLAAWGQPATSPF